MSISRELVTGIIKRLKCEEFKDIIYFMSDLSFVLTGVSEKPDGCINLRFTNISYHGFFATIDPKHKVISFEIIEIALNYTSVFDEVSIAKVYEILSELAEKCVALWQRLRIANDHEPKNIDESAIKGREMITDNYLKSMFK